MNLCMYKRPYTRGAKVYAAEISRGDQSNLSVGFWSPATTLCTSWSTSRQSQAKYFQTFCEASAISLYMAVLRMAVRLRLSCLEVPRLSVTADVNNTYKCILVHTITCTYIHKVCIKYIYMHIHALSYNYWQYLGILVIHANIQIHKK